MRTLRTVWVVSSVLAVTALSGGAAGAADKTKVDSRTRPGSAASA